MQPEPPATTSTSAVPAGTPARTPARRAALPLALTVASALLLGTVGYFGVGFGVLTSCTNDYSCTETGCPPCQGAQNWLGAGVIGQGLLLLTSVVLLILAGMRQGARRLLAVVGWALVVVSTACVVATTAVAEGSF